MAIQKANFVNVGGFANSGAPTIAPGTFYRQMVEENLSKQNNFRDQQLHNVKIQELNKARENRQANIDFGSRVLDQKDPRTWMAVGEQLNQPIISQLIFDKMAIPKKATVNSSEYNEAIKRQEEFSKWYDNQGQKEYLSEVMGREIKDRKRTGLPVTEEMLAQYAGAREKEISERDKMFTSQSNLAAANQKEADKTLLEIERLREKYASNKGSTNTNKPLTLADYDKVKKFISDIVSPNVLGIDISFGEGAIDEVLVAAMKDGRSMSDVQQAMAAGIHLGTDNTFDKKAALTALQETQKSGPYTKTNPLSRLEQLEQSQRASASDAQIKAAGYLTSPDKLRRIKANKEIEKLKIIYKK